MADSGESPTRRFAHPWTSGDARLWFRVLGATTRRTVTRSLMGAKQSRWRRGRNPRTRPLPDSMGHGAAHRRPRRRARTVPRRLERYRHRGGSLLGGDRNPLLAERRPGRVSDWLRLAASVGVPAGPYRGDPPMISQGSGPLIVLLHTASGCTRVAGRAGSSASSAAATRCSPRLAARDGIR